jgi:hypothetical protein
VVHWSSHHVSAKHPWTAGWIDIRIEDEGAPDFNWAWTIIGEDDPEGTGPDQLWQFVWPFDVDVHEVWGPERPERRWATPRGAPNPDVPEALGPGKTYRVRAGWSVETVGAALADWATKQAGRRDLRFEWDPEGEPHPGVAAAAERARATAEGAPVWDLGDGLTVVDGFMDELLVMDPDERDEVMKALRETRDGMVFGPDDLPTPA